MSSHADVLGQADTLFTLEESGNTSARIIEPFLPGLGPISSLPASAGTTFSSVEAGIDLVAIAFDADIDHVLQGETAVTFTLQNRGTVAADSFDVNILYSDDAQIDVAEDSIVGRFNITGIAPGDTLTRTVDVQLPVELLNDRAQADDSVGQGSGFKENKKVILTNWYEFLKKPIEKSIKRIKKRRNPVS